MPAKKKPKPEKADTVQRKHYARLWVASYQALRIMDAMYEADALRLPFIGFQETLDNLRAAVETEKEK